MMIFPLLILTIFSINGVIEASQSCHYPGSPRHGQLSQWVSGFPNNSIAEFSCSAGYMLLGPKTVQCLNGQWNKGTPFCVRDVARGKPVNQSEPVTTDFSSEMVVDGNDFTCTKPANHWSVSLFERSKISTVKLVFGGDLPKGSVSIRLGEDSTTNANSSLGELCAELDIEIRQNVPYFVKCDSELDAARFISIHVNPENGPVPLCVIEAHTLSGLSHEDACPLGHNDTIKDAFNGMCLEFHYISPASLKNARAICAKTDGRLLGDGHLDDFTLNYLRWRTEQFFRGSPFWLDVNSTRGAELLNASAPLNSDSDTGDCFVSSSKRGLARSDCQTANHVICTYKVVTCGRPHLPHAFHGWQVVDKLRAGRTLKNIRCSTGFYPESNEYLACDESGKISGAVRCRRFACGKQPEVKDGTSWAVSKHAVEYTCNGGKQIKGDSRVVCNSTTQEWSKPPICRTMLQAMSDWFKSAENSVEKKIDGNYQKFREYSIVEQVIFVLIVLALVALVLVGIARRVYVIRKNKGIEGALRLADEGNPFAIVVPNAR